jgi:hypothetical protein
MKQRGFCYTSYFDNGLDQTVTAQGMQDLFAYVGAFSNAPTTSAGSILGSKIAASEHKFVIYGVKMTGSPSGNY